MICTLTLNVTLNYMANLFIDVVLGMEISVEYNFIMNLNNGKIVISAESVEIATIQNQPLSLTSEEDRLKDYLNSIIFNVYMCFIQFG